MLFSRRSARWDAIAESDLRGLWREVAIGTGVARTVDTVSGPTDVVPRLESINGDDWLVRLLPGQLARDYAAVADRLAPALGAQRLRITPVGLDYVLLTLLDHDPLARVVAPFGPVAFLGEPLSLGVAEDGRVAELDVTDAAHVIVQGTTGSGKSVGLYSLLSQLTAAPDVKVTGTDPTGLLLRPWKGRWPDLPPVLGTADSQRYLTLLGVLVAEMDRRVAALPPGHDHVQLGPTCPCLLVVLEEHPGTLRLLDGIDQKLGKAYRALVSRLLAEGRKAGIRLVIVTQRADAVVVGGFERGQASHRISYRVDSREAVAMLHPDCSPHMIAEHATATPGVALLTAPGQPLVRLRSPLLTYAEYCLRVTTDPTRRAA